MAQIAIHYKTKWLSGDNSVSVNIHGRIMVLVHGTVNQVSFQLLSHLTRYGLDRTTMEHG